jgi:hypothetical protein
MDSRLLMRLAGCSVPVGATPRRQTAQLCLLPLALQVELLPLPPDVPEEVPIVCNGHEALLLVRSQRVLYDGEEIAASRCVMQLAACAQEPQAGGWGLADGSRFSTSGLRRVQPDQVTSALSSLVVVGPTLCHAATLPALGRECLNCPVL